ncbi:uncharacterized protein E0L32_011198 [Thyridium curvatum]|uniref:Carrier domain-containing protein n=1 Tax=Thyridium curvatum TaxID=1093900 RepID=A0A507B7H7_9PEZI|nr:uncharacterized protein E0L32_011198 [Thyridium curvatum]TPX19125.1 hypothetical protein E0L32_011198 [Thyridium curvatum]
MHLVPAMQHLVGEPNGHILPNGNGPDSNNTDSVESFVVSATVQAPAGLELSPASEATLILAWTLLLPRYSRDGSDLEDSTWGYTFTTDDAKTVSCKVPQLILDKSTSISQALDFVSEAITRQDPQRAASSPVYNSVFFYNGTASATVDAKISPSPPWTVRLDITALGELFQIQAQGHGNTMNRPRVEQGLNAFIDILTILIEQPNVLFREALGPLQQDLDRIWTWNAVVPPTIERCIHDMVSARAAQQPEALAVAAWDGQFLYSEIDALSTRLAQDLIVAGVQLGVPVPLCFEKTRWTVVAVLAVMKAGGTFVLTDPSQPEARLRTIVEQTGAKILLSSKSQFDLTTRIAPSDAQIIAVSNDLLGRQQSLPDVALPVVPADSPMYIIFTSGSTGKPKGVVLSHANFTSGAIPRAEAVGYRPHSRCFEFASYAFDVSIDCLLCTLTNGGCICTPSDEMRMNDLSGAIRNSKANMAHMTPSVARVLDADIMPSLEILGLGGESISAGDARAWSQKTRLVIAYGPSECTVGCTINSNAGAAKAYTNIGTGKGGLMWITDPDDHNRLMPVGSVGELLVEGPVVGIGYLDEPEKTAEVFIEDPTWLTAGHGDIPGRQGRLYKTGDLVRYDPDGSGAIVFVGRKDQQVKLRGQRVELVEIEYHLQNKLPAGVKIAAEVIKPQGGEPTLVVFLAEDGVKCGSNDAKISDELYKALSTVDDALGAELPRYMVPAAYIPLPKIPALASAKTDRKRLRELGAAMTREQVASLRIVADKTEPETENERVLFGVWKQLLGDELVVSVKDSFFALGGDSLRAMKLVAAARSQGVSLTVADVFSHPSLRDMAAVAEKIDPGTRKEVQAFSILGEGWSPDEAKATAAQLCGVDETLIEDIYPCSPLQEALMALSAKVKEAYVAQRVLKMDSAEMTKNLKSAFEQASDTCSILRTRIIQVPGRGLVQVVIRESISWRTAATVEEYLENDREESMDLGKPLVRYAIVSDEQTGTSDLVLTMHHCLYDGWSMPLVVERINRAYQGLATARAAEFRDFIHFLETTVDSKACEAYWKEQLRGATDPQFPALPWEGYQTQADSLLEVYVPMPKLSSNTTVATIIRGAWALVASQYAGTNDVLFGETLTGRNAPIAGVEEIEGPMITTVPVRVQIDQNNTVSDYLQAIYNQMITQMPYEHTGLQHIRRLSPDALQACELRTGLVLHPSTAEDPDAAHVTENAPATALVPAGDAEAAQEALKFNTYALMLVCSLDPKGFLIMASFDSKTVDKPTMEKVLAQLTQVCQQLSSEAEKRIGQIDCLTEADRETVWDLSKDLKTLDALTKEYATATSAWIVDTQDAERLRPQGSVGELLVEMEDITMLPSTSSPRWLVRGTATHKGREATLFHTGKLAKFTSKSQLVITGIKDESPGRGKKDATNMKPKAKAVSATSTKQRILRTLWSRVLRLDEKDIGLGDSFFRLGGDSIAAMKLVSEARLERLELTVAQVFANRSLYDMAGVLQGSPEEKSTSVAVSPYSSLDVANAEEFVSTGVLPALADASWKVVDVYPARPLQEIAVKGTTQLPRYSMRYEVLYFDAAVNKQRLFRSCQELVTRNEVLRTVFIRADGGCYGVVLEDMRTPVAEFEVDGDVEVFTRKLCDLDVQMRAPLGASFVKWFFVQGTALGQPSALVLRISHAQYDEICLPIFLDQLSAMYEGREVPWSYPFSHFVHHVVHENLAPSLDYWRELLAGSQMTLLRPEPAVPVTRTNHYAISKPVDISARPRDFTVATLPAAAWALCLARRTGKSDVVFGEVVSGRNTGVAHGDATTGPCWQYVPVRVTLERGVTTGADLLEAVQHQHVSSSRFEGAGLSEIIEHATDWDPAKVGWFDSVVHQDVAHVEALGFGDGERRARLETVYPHEEPLREWKVQAFHHEGGDEVTLEIVTVESWREYAGGLLDELCGVLEGLVRRPWDVVLQ